MSDIAADRGGKGTIKKRLHYAWVVLGAACILNVVSRADSASFGVFIDPLVKLFGWTRGEVSLAYSLAFIAGIPVVIVMGWMGDRFGTRRLLLAASLVITTGTLLLGTISRLWQFYIFYALFVGSVGTAAFTVLLPVALTRWFARRIGVAIGIYWAALGMGPLIFAPLLRWLIETQGWRYTFFTMGAILGSILFLFSLFIHGRPGDKGLLPYGAADTPDGPVPASTGALQFSRREWLSQPHLRCLIAIHHLGCVGHAVILAHVVSMATLQGVPGVTAAGILSTIAGMSIFSRFLYSVLTERFGGRTMLTIVLIAQGTPVLILLWAHEAWVFYLFAVIFGLGYGGEMVGFPIINRQIFGAGAPLNSLYSFEMVGANIGMALGGWLGGILFDMSGTYYWSIIASALTTYLGLPFALMLPRHRPKAVSGT